jgi:hypothetical protein
VLLEDKVVTNRCPYCGSHLTNEPAAARDMIPPEAVLPFAIDKHKAIAAFDEWIKGLWFAPNELRKFADLGRLNGLYVPFWTFDSMTITWYTGERGDDYTVTETYTETETYTNSDGSIGSRPVTRTRQVTHTRWTSVSGEVRHFFDDVLVCASSSLPEEYTTALTKAELGKLEPFKPDFLSGFVTERYTLGVKEGFDAARQIMDAEIRQLCTRSIGGNHQRLHTVHTDHLGVTFKHVLLPVWLASYRYRENTYRVMVNGQTGQVIGDRPYSAAKIVALILTILAVIAGIIALFMWLSSSGARGEAPRPTAICATGGLSASVCSESFAAGGLPASALSEDTGGQAARGTECRRADRVDSRPRSVTLTGAVCGTWPARTV